MADARITDLAAITGANIAAGDVLPVVDVSDTTENAAGSGKKTTINDLATAINTSRPQARYNASVANQAVTTADTYIVGSSIALPVTQLQAKTMYRCWFELTKTSTTGSTAATIVNVRIGVNGSTADTSRSTITFNSQTAVVDEGLYQILATFRTVGSGTSAVLQSVGLIYHRGSTTGLASAQAAPKRVTGGGFDSTVANTIIGVSFTGGASFAGNLDLVQAELLNLAL